MKKIVGLVWLLVVTPIWFYLMYKILVAVNATELMWFLYWIYMPTALLAGVLSKLAED